MFLIRGILLVLQALWLVLVSFTGYYLFLGLAVRPGMMLTELGLLAMASLVATVVAWALPATALGVLMLCTWSAEKP